MDKKEIFAKVPLRVLTDYRLSRNDLKIYGAIASFQGNNENCFPSREKIAERSGIHISRISKHTRRLEEYGHLLKTRRGKRISNVYYLSDGVESATSSSLNEITNVSDSVEPAQCDVAEPAQSDSVESAHSNIKRTIKRTDEKNTIFSSLKNFWITEYKNLYRSDYQFTTDEEKMLSWLASVYGK
jgi:DNA-binding MarR family transcriptional regulator